ncbi:hypothetical protein [Streptomyces sp. NPDC088816]|uniref:hypothetical protein n=1 Tax=Streptomyces sp. NPDC088816 TaxID=3365906 RepID=UPI0037FF26ED
MGRLTRPEGLGVGERVRFNGQIRLVLAVSGRAVTLSDMDGTPRPVPPAMLFADDDFEVVDSSGRMPLPPVSLVETLPQATLEKALWWEGHILEVLRGLPPDAEAGTEPKPQYGPSRSLTARERAKAVELTAAGHRVSASTVANYRRRYEASGVMGLVDHRPVRKTPKYGTVNDVVVAAMSQAISEATDASTRTGTFLLWRTEQILKAASEGREVKLPSRRTLYRLLDKLTAGTHTTGSATTRRSRAHGATAPFGELPAFAPGEVMQIDSTPLDVLVRLDDGVAGAVELTGMIDVATRTVTAAVLRPTTKAVDASVLLARTVTPELMRPGWVDALRMSRSVLPHRRLLTLDERLEHAAARPVIVPEMIVCDHGKAFMSRNFLASCRFLQIDLQPAHKGSPFEKGHIEKMLASVGTLFTQFLPGFTGRTTEHRGRHLDTARRPEPGRPTWSLKTSMSRAQSSMSQDTGQERAWRSATCCTTLPWTPPAWLRPRPGRSTGRPRPVSAGTRFRVWAVVGRPVRRGSSRCPVMAAGGWTAAGTALWPPSACSRPGCRARRYKTPPVRRAKPWTSIV